MTDHAENLTHALHGVASSKAATIANTSVAGGVVVSTANPELVTASNIGSYLSTHAPLDIGVLSYTEYLQLLGSIYILYQLINAFKTHIGARKMPAKPRVKPVKK